MKSKLSLLGLVWVLAGCNSTTPESTAALAGKALAANHFVDWTKIVEVNSSLAQAATFAHLRARWEKYGKSWQIAAVTLMNEYAESPASAQTTRARIYQVSVLERNEIAFRVEVICRKTFLALSPLDLSLSFGGSGPGWEVHAEEFGAPVAISPVDCKLRQVFDVQN